MGQKAKKAEAGNLSCVDEIMRYEAGEMGDDEVVVFFQKLIDTGLAWQLQGCYGRQAARLIEQGLCRR